MAYGDEGTVVAAPVAVAGNDVTVVEAVEAGGPLAVAAPGSCLILLALKAMLLAAAKAGVNRGDSARTTVAAEGKVIPVFETWSSQWFVGVDGAVGVAVPDPVRRKKIVFLSASKMFIKIGDLTSTIISSEKKLPLPEFMKSYTV